MKPIKLSIAVMLENPDNKTEFLHIKRPPDDKRFPNLWGLPAVTNHGEDILESVRRVGIEKLNIKIEPLRYLGVKSIQRDTFTLILIDIRAKIIDDRQPSVFEAPTKDTKYTDQRWISDFYLLKEAASKGSLCSQILLDRVGMSY